jgi:hypothetical protein
LKPEQKYKVEIEEKTVEDMISVAEVELEKCTLWQGGAVNVLKFRHGRKSIVKELVKAVRKN